MNRVDDRGLVLNPRNRVLDRSHALDHTRGRDRSHDRDQDHRPDLLPTDVVHMVSRIEEGEAEAEATVVIGLDLGRLGVEEFMVEVLTAEVHTVAPHSGSTIDAAATWDQSEGGSRLGVGEDFHLDHHQDDADRPHILLEDVDHHRLTKGAIHEPDLRRLT